MTALMPAWAQATPISIERYHQAHSAGFNAAWEYLAPLLARAESDADYWYLRATYTAEEIDAMHQAAIDAAFEAGRIQWLDQPEPTASWADARQGAS